MTRLPAGVVIPWWERAEMTPTEYRDQRAQNETEAKAAGITPGPAGRPSVRVVMSDDQTASVDVLTQSLTRDRLVEMAAVHGLTWSLQTTTRELATMIVLSIPDHESETMDGNTEETESTEEADHG